MRPTGFYFGDLIKCTHTHDGLSISATNKRDFLMEVGDFSFLLREIVLFRAWGSQGRRRSWVRGPFLEVIKAGVLRESALDTVDYGASSIIY
ncbi:uncharacterized protein LOC135170491 isoform X3 [Diachasmimorpha longicaudata]|uniref:uncharacterized protein LOC135170491 isoform X3 n=1 Tax=Diachasmimorpha longicaudata TaxID=58733 RepID=UPI0030B87C8A